MVIDQQTLDGCRAGCGDLRKCMFVFFWEEYIGQVSTVLLQACSFPHELQNPVFGQVANSMFGLEGGRRRSYVADTTGKWHQIVV